MGETRILLTTVYRKDRNELHYDYFGSNTLTSMRFITPRYISMGLRFLKQNIPQIEIMEYPLWEEYVEKLKKGWDVVGFSFYLNETHEIIKMAEEARKQGIKELWAGNYGALTPGMEKYFDKLFFGYAEEMVGELLGKKIKKIIHPPLFGLLKVGPFGFKYKIMGYLFTQRGCHFRCSFCQTPAFCPKPKKIPLESIERVLHYYKSQGVREVIIPDENFGIFKEHTEQVVELLEKLGFFWTAMVRADTLLNSLTHWVKSGLVAGLIGVESLSQQTLEAVEKREKVETITELIRKAHQLNCFIGGYYMIGYENDTYESIQEDIKTLSRLKIDFNQLCVITPLPRTSFWDRVEEKYGIFEKDWHKFDAKHLVFNHPNITPREMEELLIWGFKQLNPPIRYLQAIYRLTRRYSQQHPFYLFTPIIHALPFDCHDRSHRWFFEVEV